MALQLKVPGVAIEQLDDCSNTPVLYACYLGRQRFVKLLVEAGANFNRINIYGERFSAIIFTTSF